MPGKIVLKRRIDNTSRAEINEYVAYLHKSIKMQHLEIIGLKDRLRVKREETKQRKLDPYKILFNMIRVEQQIPEHDMPKRQKKYLYYLILFHIHKHGTITNNEFHGHAYRRFAIPRLSNVTRMLNKMMEYGLVDVVNPNRLYKRYFITEKGRVYADKIGGLIAQYFEPIKVKTGNASLWNRLPDTETTPTEEHSGLESEETEISGNGDTGSV